MTESWIVLSNVPTSSCFSIPTGLIALSSFRALTKVVISSSHAAVSAGRLVKSAPARILSGSSTSKIDGRLLMSKIRL